ncbi:MAG: hypothetical protein ACRD4U_12100 [Candidatus Acidiferrales bacterium]
MLGMILLLVCSSLPAEACQRRGVAKAGAPVLEELSAGASA